MQQPLRPCRASPASALPRRGRGAYIGMDRNEAAPMTRTATLSFALAGATLVAAAGALWATYGTGVYLEALLTGLAGCFG